MSETTTNSQGPPQYVGYVHTCCEHAEQLRAENERLERALEETTTALEVRLCDYECNEYTCGREGALGLACMPARALVQDNRAALEGKDA